MREICFKAKRKDNGEWVEGFYFCMTHDDGRHTHHFILPVGADLSLGTPIEKIQVEIDVETLCQYTELIDYNMNGIWEKDIVRCYDYNSGSQFFAVVKFGNPNGYYSWGYQLKHIDGDEPNLDILLWINMEETGATCEVIGNIFDNPELMNTTETIGYADNGGLMSAT